ncbi:succinate dehydrogenase, cytochrome b556 subunit [marine gamma proteobacterium HTCC2148]|jgi:succinate dehydrogenase / fumarate reductase cytochrome b subunit|nr:succinate dehydrogenase, cytochrome b556 subunit [marine gamma proteobacterium HTCC2148]
MMVSKVKDNRPVNLDIGTMRLPITAWASITHRATGVILFVGMGILLWLLDTSLAGPDGFAFVQESLGGFVAKFVIWGLVTALIYHSLAGVKHLIMDFGVGETMEGGILGARIVIALSVVLSLLTVIWIW